MEDGPNALPLIKQLILVGGAFRSHREDSKIAVAGPGNAGVRNNGADAIDDFERWQLMRVGVASGLLQGRTVEPERRERSSQVADLGDQMWVRGRQVAVSISNAG